MKSSFEFKPNGMYNFVSDDSATGKTWIANVIQNNYINTVDETTNDIIVFNGRNYDFFDPQKDYNQLVLMDEDMFPLLYRKNLWKDITKSNNIYLFMGRFKPTVFYIDPCCEYSLICNNHHYKLVPKQIAHID